MAKWAHKVISLERLKLHERYRHLVQGKGVPEAIQAVLDEEGKSGWELVSVIGSANTSTEAAYAFLKKKI